MKLLLGGLRIIFYLMATVVCLGLVVSPIPLSWWSASQRDHVTSGSMQWCIVAKTPVVKGMKLTNENVDWTIRRVPAGNQFIPDAKSAIGKYAIVNLAKGELLKPECLSEFALSKAPDGGAAIPVDVKMEHTGSLRPGMQLAFVQEQEKEKIMIPEAKKHMDQTVQSGFELLSVVASSKDTSVATLIIAVDKIDLAYVPNLASGQWRPVILSNPK